MSWTQVSSVSVGETGSSTTPIVTGAINTATADLIVAVVSGYGTAAVAGAMTDSVGNSYSLAGTQASADDSVMKVAIFYKITPTTNAAHTFTFTPSTGVMPYPSLVVRAFTQGSAPTYVGLTSSGVGGTTALAGSLGHADALVVAGLAWYTNNTMAIGSSFATPVEVGYTAQHIGAASSWKQVSGAVNPQWSWTGTNVAAAMAVEFTGTSGVAEVTGTASVTLAALTAASAGTVEIAGVLALTLGAMSLASAGTVDVAGSSTLLLADVTAVSTGTVEALGALTATLGALTLVGDGVVGSLPITGDAALLLADVTTVSAGQVEIAGQVTVTLEALSGVLLGTTVAAGISGVLNSVLEALTMEMVSTWQPVAAPGERFQTVLAGSRTTTVLDHSGVY